MNKGLLIRLTAYTVCPLLIAAGACGRTQTTRFYTLSSLIDSEKVARAAGPGRGVAVGIGPIEFPEYLDRPQIVTRLGPNEVRFAEFHRWAGGLAENLSGTLAENLSVLLGSERIALYPWKSTTPIDCRVEVRIARFEGEPGGRVLLQGRWSLFSPDRKTLLAARASSLDEPVEGEDYEALVAAQSRALVSLSREIARAIESLPRDAPGE
jgi:hypothetical protein